jgi:hypothetical protein
MVNLIENIDKGDVIPIFPCVYNDFIPQGTKVIL